MRSKTLLIDGDLLIYRACAAVEQDVRWDDEFHILYSRFEDAWENVESDLERLFARFDTRKHLIALTCGRNFRYTVDPTYKSNRAGQRKPLAFTEVREKLEADFNTFKHEGIEADDVLGIFATRDRNSIICSADKDMKTVPATVFDGKEVQYVDVVSADRAFFTQVLTGDSADGYPGCPGIGPVRAATIIKTAEVEAATRPAEDWHAVVWQHVVNAYKKAGLAEDDAVRQARLARILRNSDWDAEKKEQILWAPRK